MEDLQITAFTQMMNTVNAGDAPGYARLYAQDAVITIYGGVELNGREAIEQYEVELMREFPGVRFALYSVCQNGEFAVVHYGVNGKTSGGQSMGHEGLLFYRFDQAGLIEDERRYLDSLTPMAQLGMFGAGRARDLPKLPTKLKAYVAKASPDEMKNVALVKANLLAVDEKNEASFLSSISEDAVLDEMILPQPFIGKQNIRAWFETWTSAVPDATTEIINILGVGDFVLVETIAHGKLKGPLGLLKGSNKPFAVHRAAIVQVKAGKINLISAFMNGKELAEAIGQWPLAIGK